MLRENKLYFPTKEPMLCHFQWYTKFPIDLALDYKISETQAAYLPLDNTQTPGTLALTPNAPR